MATSSSTTTVKPIYRIARVLYGVAGNLEQIVGLDWLNDTSATLNAKYGTQSTILPATHPTLNYFGVGINGKRNVSTGNLTQPNEISLTNMDLYTPIPIRMVPVEEDLTAADRANYRMRYVRTVGTDSQQYACYMLKTITKVNSRIQFYKLDSSGNMEAYTPDYSNLNPTPPTASTDGTVATVGAEINAVAVVTVSLTGTEISEAISILYNGDARYANISELGLYTGTDATVTANDYQNNSFSYTEAILAQLHTHYTFNGTDMSTPNALYSEQFSIGSGRVILL